MTPVNARGEVADIVDTSQFARGLSAYMCVAFAAALIRYAGRPGQGPTGTAGQVALLAESWYSREEGGDAATNQNGMSLSALYTMLRGMGLRFNGCPVTGHAGSDVALIKAWLAQGRLLLVCGAETGMVDLAVGDRVPYSWTPTGNHAIIVSGVAADGNLLVHDTANVDAHGVRPGPRTYDALRMHLVSITAVVPPWLERASPVPTAPAVPPKKKEEEKEMPKSITIAEVAQAFRARDAQHWECIHPHKPYSGRIIQYGLLDAYKAYGNAGLCGYSFLGLPCSDERPIGHEDVVQFFQYGVLRWKSGVVGPVDLYATGSPGQDPWIAQLEAMIQQLRSAQGTTPDTSAALKDLQTIHAISAKY